MKVVLRIVGLVGIILVGSYIKAGNPIVASYVSAVLMVGLFLMLLFEGYLFGKKYTIQPSKNLTQKEKDFIEKHKLIFEIIHRTLWFSLVIGGTILVIIPCIKDLPALINGNYSYVTGEIVSVAHDAGNRKEIQIKDNATGKTFYVEINYEEIKIGQEYTIKYLPNIKCGEIILVSPTE